MKKFTILIILIITLSCSGTYSRFRVTGTPFSPLEEDKDIKIVTEADTSEYEEIGIAEVKNSNRDSRIDEAKRLARLYGGEIIMPLNNKAGSDEESFRVLSPIMELEEEKPLPAEPEKPAVKEPEKPDYSKLPHVPYNILKGEITNLAGEKFRGTMLPVRFMEARGDIAQLAGKNNKILELKTVKGGNIAYLIIPAQKVKKVNPLIKLKQKLNFAYTPASLFRNSIPVLKLIDIID